LPLKTGGFEVGTATTSLFVDTAFAFACVPATVSLTIFFLISSFH